MALSLVTGPTSEPVSVDDAKEFLRVDGGDDDALIGSLITAARQHIDGRDGWLGRCLITQTWDLFLERFPGFGLWGYYANLPPVAGYGNYRYEMQDIIVSLPPLQSVTSITYTDTAGAPQTLNSSTYVVDATSQPGRIMPAVGQTWPATRPQVNAAVVRFVAGYGVADAVPEPIRMAIKAMVAHWYENREPAGALLSPLPMHLDALLAPYRIRIEDFAGQQARPWAYA